MSPLSVSFNISFVSDVMEGFLMKKKQAHMISLLTLPDPSLHYSLELKYVCRLPYSWKFSRVLIFAVFAERHASMKNKCVHA